LIAQAQALGEPLDDPWLLLSVLWGFWAASYIGFNGDLMRELAAEFLALAEKQRETAQLHAAHRIWAITLSFTGDIVAARAHYDRAFALSDPAGDDLPTTYFGTPPRVSAPSFRALTLWLLGYPDAAQADIDVAVKEARGIGQAASLMLALGMTNYVHLLSGNHVAAAGFADELSALADEKGTPFRQAEALFQRGCVFALTGGYLDAVQLMSSGIAAWRATGAKLQTPLHMSSLANAHARLGRFDVTSRCIDEAVAAITTNKETWCEVDVYRVAGEIALLSGGKRVAEAEAHFEHALAVARQQQARSFELRAAMSMARLLRDQGKREEARDLLTPTYDWFTEGFDTRDLKEAKALLEELQA
jgi:predicted ATPase